MSIGNWPWPEDSKEDRLRRIIDHYRSALAEVDMEACINLDNRMIAYGQPWVCDNSVIDVNEMLSAKAICERFGLEEFNVRAWARRHPERIRKHKASNGRTLFRVGDVLAYNAMKGREK